MCSDTPASDHNRSRAVRDLSELNKADFRKGRWPTIMVSTTANMALMLSRSLS